MKYFTFKYSLPFIVLFIFCLSNFNAAEEEKSDTSVVLEKLINDYNLIFESIKKDADSTAQLIAKTGIDSPDVNKVIKDLSLKHPEIHSFALITNQGVLKNICPEEYKKHEGTDISHQPHVEYCIKNHKPTLSKRFKAIQGFDAVSICIPVMKEKELLGLISILILPDIFLGKIIDKESAGMPTHIWVMEKSGVILYDPDTIEIGKNVFEDELYKPFTEFLDAAKKINSESKGKVYYEYLAPGLKEKTIKQAYWSTIKIYDSEWKIIVTTCVDKREVPKLQKADFDKLKQDFRNFAKNKDNLLIFEKDDEQAIMKKFEDFYQKHPMLYNISWIDKNLIGRFGFPKSTSIKNMKIDDKYTNDFFKKVENAPKFEETETEYSLFEGGAGYNFMCTLVSDNKFLGAVYFIVKTK